MNMSNPVQSTRSRFTLPRERGHVPPIIVGPLARIWLFQGGSPPQAGRPPPSGMSEPPSPATQGFPGHSSRQISTACVGVCRLDVPLLWFAEAHEGTATEDLGMEYEAFAKLLARRTVTATDGCVYFRLFDYLTLTSPVTELISELNGKKHLHIDCLTEAGDSAIP